MILRFCSGSVIPASLPRKSVARVAMDERDVVVAAEERHDLFRLAGAHHAGVDEDAGELIAQRLVQQHRRDRDVDAAREAADHAALADLRADARDRLAAERRHRPIAAAERDAMREVAEQRRALRRVHDLGMELHAVEAALVVGDGGEGRAFGNADDAEAFGQRLDAIAVAHPHLLARAFLPKAGEQRAIVGDVEEGAAEFAMIRGRDAAAQLRAHRLLAIADAEHRHAELEHRIGRARAGILGHRGRAAGEDHRFRREGGDLLGIHQVEGMDLAIDAAFAHAARDELRHLAAEIEDENAVGGGGGHFGITLASAARSLQP